MRIAVVTTEFPFLSETFVLNQVTGLIDLGHEVDIHAVHQGQDDDSVQDGHALSGRTLTGEMPWSPWLRLVRAPRVLLDQPPHRRRLLLSTLLPFGSGADALSLRLFYRALTFLDRSYDAVLCHFGPNAEHIARLTELGIIEAPVMVFFHGYDLRMLDSGSGPRYHALRRSRATLAAISAYTRKRLVAAGFAPERIVDHAMGIDLDRFAFRPPRDDLRSEERPIELLSVGRLAPEKDHEVALRALQQVVRAYPSWSISYTIVGDGPLAGRLAEVVRELDLGDHVRMVGALAHEEVAEAMIGADIFLLPSREEVLPMVIMEACATGLPVVATDVGAVAELVDDGVTGYVVPPGDPEAFGDAIGRLLDAPERQREMALRGRERVERRHDIRRLNARLARLLRALAAGEGGAGEPARLP